MMDNTHENISEANQAVQGKQNSDEPAAAAKQKSLKYNVIMNTILTVVSVIFPLISFPYVSRILNPDGIGSVSFAQSFIAYFTMLASLGVPIYGIRACAKVRDDKEKLSQTVQEIMIINLILTVFAYACLLLSVVFIETINQQKYLILIVSVSILLSSISISWLYSALEEYTYITIRTIIFNVLSIICIFIFIREKEDYIIYAVISVLAATGSGVLNLIHSGKFISFKKKAKYNFRQHLKPIIILFFMTATISIYTNLDKVMLGFMIDDNNVSVGIYDASVKIYRVFIALITALGAVLLPRISYYFQQKKLDEIKALISKGVNLVFTLSIPVVIFFAFYSKEAIILFCGENFADSVLPLQIMLPAVLFVGLSNITGIQMLVAMGREKLVVLSTSIGAVIDFVLNIILIPYWGVAATAFSTLAAEFAILVVQIIILREYIPVLLKGVKILKLLTIGLVLAAVAYAFTFVNLSNFLILLCAGSAFAVIYFIILLLFKEPMLLDLLKALLNLLKSSVKKIRRKNPKERTNENSALPKP